MRQDKQIKFFDFLVEHANSGAPFTREQVMRATGWAQSTAQTYLAKQVRDLVDRREDGLFVRRELLRLSKDQFLALVTQKEYILPRYERTSYENLVTYEFLLPLTKEDTLRRTLDELFYRDTLEQRIQQIDPRILQNAVQRGADEKQQEYVSRVADVVSGMFDGYSITHVNGRFLAAPLATRREAVGRRYIIDETTAIVRFIVPCQAGRNTHGESFDGSRQVQVDHDALEDEMITIRTLFFSIFLEAVVQAVKEEDEIWLLESAASRTRLYTWGKR